MVAPGASDLGDWWEGEVEGRAGGRGGMALEETKSGMEKKVQFGPGN